MTTPAGQVNVNDFQTRAAALLQPSATQHNRGASPALSGEPALSSGPTVTEKQPDAGDSASRTNSHSLSSNANTLASSPKGSGAGRNTGEHRPVRTLPPWVHSVDEDDDDLDPSKHLLKAPNSVRPASHHYMPQPKPNAEFGRHFDHERERTPVTISAPLVEYAPTWHAYAKASEYGRSSSERGELVDDEWMRENLPDLEQPWQPQEEKARSEQYQGFWLFSPVRRKMWVKRRHRTLMRNPIVPLVFRLTVITFSALALGLSGSIFHKARTSGCERGSSTWMAVIVDVVAIVYSLYITYDEYSSKPLGLRSPKAKLRLIFLDLFFIVFDSANLSLAFQALTDERWACRQGIFSDPGQTRTTCPLNNDLCVRQKALTGTLLIALVAWLVTFAISSLRVVERGFR